MKKSIEAKHSRLLLSKSNKNSYFLKGAQHMVAPAKPSGVSQHPLVHQPTGHHQKPEQNHHASYGQASSHQEHQKPQVLSFEHQPGNYGSGSQSKSNTWNEKIDIKLIKQTSKFKKNSNLDDIEWKMNIILYFTC